ncbi:MAG TPA: protein kinase [Bryobacteraceae bacterium]|nr:protein kinase [Bryobacteraceae bacterium]
MPLIPGARLGPYEVKGPIGAGGMGEVYRAHDARLHRDVALKILTHEATADPSRRSRFELEARAVAALNHPNIVSVYDVGIEEGVPYIVSEFIPGEPLRGRLTVPKAIDAARQIARGLAAAHGAGITHRDLKPDNILRTREGHVKILDFGLAKVNDTLAAPSDSAETLTLRTRPGVVMGTVAYMSPEQVRGEELDHRSDLFSVGLILHEMLTGERAFRGATPVEVMNAILKQEPPELPDTVPAALRQIVAHCLEKDARERFQSAGDLEFALKALAENQSGSLLANPHRGRQKRMFIVLAAAAVILLAAGLLIGRWWWRTPAPPVWSGVRLGGPEVSWGPQLSPDGHTLALASYVDGSSQPVVMKPESGNYAILSRDRSHGYVWQVSWSSDGTLLYYDRHVDGPKGIFSVPALGGEQRLVLPDAGSPRTLSDGTLLVNRINADRQLQIYRFWPESGKLQALPFLASRSATTVPCAVAPFPDRAEALVYGIPVGADTSEQPHLYDIDLITGKSRRFAPDLAVDSGLLSFAVPRNSDSILLSRMRGSLCEVDAIARTGRAPLRALFTSALRAAVLDGAADGSIYADQVEMSAEVVRFSAAGGPVESLARVPQGRVPFLSVLPGGQAVIASVIFGRTHLVVIEKGKEPADLLTTSEETSGPFASNSKEIAFALGPAPRETIGVASLSTGRIVRRIAAGKGPLTAVAFAPDGSIYFGAGAFIWHAENGGAIQRITAGESVAVGTGGLIVKVSENDKIHLLRVSPDGTVTGEVESMEPIVPSSPNPLSADAVSAAGRILCPLAPVGAHLFVPGVTGKSGKLERIPIDYQGDIHALAWAPDGRIIAFAAIRRSRIWKFSPSRVDSLR